MNWTLLLGFALLVAVVAVWWLRRRLDEVRADLEAAERRAAELVAVRDALEVRIDIAQAALDGARLGVLVVDPSGAVVRTNPAAEEFVGARHGAALAEANLRRLVEAAMESEGEVVHELEIRIPAPRTIRIAVEPILASRWAVAYIDDVTERRKVDAARTDFVANVSHELKTPLGALVLLADTLEGDADPQARSRLIARIGEQAGRMTQLVDDLLDLSLVEAAGLEPAVVDLQKVVAASAAHVRDIARSSEVDLVIDSDAEPIHVLGDERQLVSAVGNLLTNAIRYTTVSAGRRVVTAGARRVAEGAVIEVSDTGIGIPLKHHPRIFERFYRVDHGRERATGGTGLGLAIVRHVAMNHGGTVAVESESGVGSTFTITIPQPPEGGHVISVLLVEDEPAYVEALEVALAKDGFEVRSAGDGREGLKAFQEFGPDVVLLDLMLPGLQGLDVLRKIRQTSSTPVIVVSAKDQESDVVTALELGADDYLTKPYSLRELVARINAMMRRSGFDTDEPVALTAGSAVLDESRYELRIGDDVRFDLPRKEFEVLRMLMAKPGRIVTRELLLEEVWGYTWGDSKTLDQHIRRIRRKLDQVDEAPRIETVRGVGYRLEAS